MKNPAMAENGTTNNGPIASACATLMVAHDNK